MQKPKFIVAHSVSEDLAEFGPGRDSTTLVSDFEIVLDHLSRHEAIDPEDFPSHMGPLKESGSGLLTFDDGYRDNYNVVLPLLEKYQVPALIFVTSSFLDGHLVPYEHQLVDMLMDLEEVALPQEGKQSVKSLDDKEKCYLNVRMQLKKLSPGRRIKELSKLMAYNDFSPDQSTGARMMTSGEVKELSNHPLVTIGAHSVHHPMLNRLSPWKVWGEISESKRELEAITGGEIRHFAFPYGAHSLWSRRCAKWAGFQCSFSTDRGLRRSNGSYHPHAIARTDIRDFVDDVKRTG